MFKLITKSSKSSLNEELWTLRFVCCFLIKFLQLVEPRTLSYNNTILWILKKSDSALHKNTFKTLSADPHWLRLTVDDFAVDARGSFLS